MKIRNIIRSAATALTAALILPFAVSCGNTTAADTTAGSQTEPPPEKKSYTVIENGTSNYSIKAGRMVTQLCTSSLELMQNAFRAVYGTSPATDGTAPFIELAIEGGRRDCCIEFDEETGNIRITGVDRAIVIYYNTTLAGDYKIGNLYDVVLDGQWTIDLLIQYSKDAWVDTNQSGAPDMADKVGLLSSGGASAYDAFLTAFGIDMLAKTADGGLEIAWDPDKVSSAIDYNIALLNENNGTYTDSDDANQINKFTNDEALFWLFYIYPSAEVNTALRNMPSGYGLLPLPKYDLNQENYYTTAQNAYSTMSIMATSKHLNEVGTVFEEWNYRSYMDILPAYCEVIMKTRYLVDVESGMVFDLIRESIKFDTGMIYGHELENIGTFTRSIVQSGNNTFASTYKVQEKVYKNRITQLLKDFEGRMQ